MSDLLSVTQLRAHIETALSDDALGQLRDAKQALIVKWAGPAGSLSETHWCHGMDLLPLKREPASVTSVTDVSEGREWPLADGTDYLVRGAALWRTHGVWGEYTTVVYEPADDGAERIATLVQLIKLAINFEPGFSTQSEGQWTEGYATYLAQQNMLLRALREPEVFG